MPNLNHRFEEGLDFSALVDLAQLWKDLVEAYTPSNSYVVARLDCKIGLASPTDMDLQFSLYTNEPEPGWITMSFKTCPRFLQWLIAGVPEPKKEEEGDQS